MYLQMGTTGMHGRRPSLANVAGIHEGFVISCRTNSLNDHRVQHSSSTHSVKGSYPASSSDAQVDSGDVDVIMDNESHSDICTRAHSAVHFCNHLVDLSGVGRCYYKSGPD